MASAVLQVQNQELVKQVPRVMTTADTRTFANFQEAQQLRKVSPLEISTSRPATIATLEGGLGRNIECAELASVME